MLAELIEDLERLDPAIRSVFLKFLKVVERHLEDTVKREDFSELKEVVKELTEAHREAEERLTRLEKVIEELAEAQRETEKRINELTEAQKKSEERLTRLERIVEELAEAQKKTEQRVTRLEKSVEELAEAQKRTEQRLSELAEAQKKTEKELQKLIKEHTKTREQLGGLAHTVGYMLEDRSYYHLPKLIKKDFGVDVKELKRDYVEISPGRYEEVNVIGEGKKGGRTIYIVGEVKSQLKKSDVDRFIKKIKRIEDLLPGEKLYLIVTYAASPQVQEYVRKNGIKLYFSYQFGFS